MNKEQEKIYKKWFKKTDNLELLVRACRRYFGINEEWRNISGHADRYQASSFGRIRRKARSGRYELSRNKYSFPDTILKQRISPAGYMRINFSVKGHHKTFSAHRLVLESFIPNPENKRTINHKDGNRRNNIITNLEWSTYSENITHSFRELGKRNHTTRRVNQYDLNGNFIKKWDSIKEAYKTIGLGEMTISNYLTGKVVNPKKYKWEYAD